MDAPQRSQKGKRAELSHSVYNSFDIFDKSVLGLVSIKHTHFDNVWLGVAHEVWLAVARDALPKVEIFANDIVAISNT